MPEPSSSRAGLERPVFVEPILKRKRYRFRRKHTPHFYLVTAALTCAALLAGLEGVDIASRSVTLGNVSFWLTCATALVVFAAYFYGFFLIMHRDIPASRMKVILPHAIVGTLSPLVYAMNVTIAFDDLGSRPVTGFAFGAALVSFFLLCGQYRMGRAVVKVDRPRILRPPQRLAS